MKKHALPLSVTFPPASHMNPVEAVGFLYEHGFDSMDFNFVAAIDMYGDDWHEMIAEVKKEAERTGMIIVSGHLPFRDKTPEILHQKVLKTIEMAGELGIKRAVLHPIGDGMMPAGEENNKYWFQKNLEFYNTYIPYAEKAGIKLVTENMRDAHQAEGCHRYGSTADELIELADALGLEICWDFGHAHEAKLDHYTELLKIGNRLTMTHINDNWQGPDDEHLPPFYGTGDWDAACRGLREIGYSNPLNFELKFKKLPIQILPYATDLARAIGELLLDKITESPARKSS
ncbi:MAG: sugar phosphate isomerase/epimerase [Clostridia bacterium]|nr:sugar phosphate isomerase/epimerase [Clostridia bacterium]